MVCDAYSKTIATLNKTDDEQSYLVSNVANVANISHLKIAIKLPVSLGNVANSALFFQTHET